MGLNNAFPDLQSKDDFLVPIEGFPPNLIYPPEGCRFKDRCPFSISKCDEKPKRSFDNDREVICWRTDESENLLEQSKKITTWSAHE